MCTCPVPYHHIPLSIYTCPVPYHHIPLSIYTCPETYHHIPLSIYTCPVTYHHIPLSPLHSSPSHLATPHQTPLHSAGSLQTNSQFLHPVSAVALCASLHGLTFSTSVQGTWQTTVQPETSKLLISHNCHKFYHSYFAL